MAQKCIFTGIVFVWQLQAFNDIILSVVIILFMTQTLQAIYCPYIDDEKMQEIIMLK